MKRNSTIQRLRHWLSSASVLVFTLVAVAGSLPSTVWAQTTSTTTPRFSLQIVPPSCTDEDGCNICEVVKIFTNAADIIGVFLSSLALLMFIIGGFMWIFSAGVPDRIEKGKKIILGTLTGLAIVFLAWFAVNVIVRVSSSSGVNSSAGLTTSTQIFSRDWWDLSYCTPAKPTICKGYSIGTICGWGDPGCASADSCTCYRTVDPSGDDNLCTGDDVTSAGSATYTGKKCFCASQCSRLQQKTSAGYSCIPASTYNTTTFEAATGVTCPAVTAVSAGASTTTQYTCAKAKTP
jgi:hypothetical protein